MSARGVLARGLLGLALLAGAAAGGVLWLNREDRAADPPPPTVRADPLRGALLARAGNCAGCHTARGGADYAGGRPIATPFGMLFTANLTPDPVHGIGRWTEADFWRALHHGRSADGRLLAPACPYPNFTQVSRTDTADLFAFLQGLPPVAQAEPPHALRGLYGTQAALAAWRALYFRPGTPPADRGEALVAGLGHCSACHGRRNAWGATGGPLDLAGGDIPMQGWVAPALDDPREGGVAHWPLEDVVALLRDGHAPQAGVAGPMARVVADSTQHLPEAELRAMAAFLQRLPQRQTVPPAPEAAEPAQQALGAKVYERHCADCHGAQGQGARAAGGPASGPWLVPPLAGNRAVVMDRPDNVIRVVLNGGYGPATAGRPLPHGMPPYATLLSDEEIAAVVTHLRTSWGHRANPVGALAVARQRGAGD